MKHTLGCLVLAVIFFIIWREHPETLRISTDALALTTAAEGPQSSTPLFGEENTTSTEDAAAFERRYQLQLIDREIEAIQTRMRQLIQKREGVISSRELTMRKYEDQIKALQIKRETLVHGSEQF